MGPAAAPSPAPIPKDPASCQWVDTSTQDSLGSMLDKTSWESNQGHLACTGSCPGGMETCKAVVGVSTVTCGGCQTPDDPPAGRACSRP